MTKEEYIKSKIEQIISVKDSLKRYKDDKKIKFRDEKIESDVTRLDFVVTLISAENLLDELQDSYEHALNSLKDKE